jgi:DNA-binding ferritin-like protein
MALKSLFPEEMMNKSNGGGSLSLESIASKLITFELQLQLVHWQTSKYSEHKATGSLYEYLQEFRDGVMEKLMGYTGRKPSNLTIGSITSVTSTVIGMEVCSFATSLKSFAEMNNYLDIGNMADELSGEGNKFKYLLTLS